MIHHQRPMLSVGQAPALQLDVAVNVSRDAKARRADEIALSRKPAPHPSAVICEPDRLVQTVPDHDGPAHLRHGRLFPPLACHPSQTARCYWEPKMSGHFPRHRLRFVQPYTCRRICWKKPATRPSTWAATPCDLRSRSWSSALFAPNCNG